MTCLDRTYEELKHLVVLGLFLQKLHSLDRTYEELKRPPYAGTNSVIAVWIVPMRN